MSRQVSPSTDRVYGLQRVTRIWGVSRATLYRHRRPAGVAERKRPGPRGATSDDDLVAAIRQLLTGRPFHGEGHRKLWARLRFEGRRTSRRRVLRLMREHGLLVHQRVGRPHGSRAHDGRITTERVDVMWGSDLTSVMTGEGQAALQRAYASCAHGHAAVMAVDHCSAECVGIHASHRADRFEALEPVKQAVRERFGAFAKGVAAGLQLRHDHGSQYVSHHFQTEIRFLGIESSPAFVREPEGNGCAERFIRTLKENLLWVRSFATVEELRLALLAFKQTYNQSWIIERHGYQTPAQVRADQIGPMSVAAKAQSSVSNPWTGTHGKRLEGSQAFPAGTHIPVPTGVAAFPDPVFVPPPRSFAEKTYNVVHWSDMPKGGHFAALEQPELMLADLRAFIATVSVARP